MAAHLTAFLGVGLADLLPRPEQSRAIFSLLVLALVPPHVAVLGLVAIRPSMMRQTSPGGCFLMPPSKDPASAGPLRCVHALNLAKGF